MEDCTSIAEVSGYAWKNALVLQRVQSTPADNTRKRVWQYIEKERKRKKETN